MILILPHFRHLAPYQKCILYIQFPGKVVSHKVEGSILDAGAQQWADAMAAQGAVSHDPQLTAGYSDDWRRMGENVSTGSSISVLHAASLNIAAATVLDPNATLVGVGVSVQPGAVYLVERTVT